MQVDRYKTHDIEVVIDRKVGKDRFRIAQSVKTAMKDGKGIIVCYFLDAPKKEQIKYFSKFLMDPKSGISYDEPAPNMFSFNFHMVHVKHVMVWVKLKRSQKKQLFQTILKALQVVVLFLWENIETSIFLK